MWPQFVSTYKCIILPVTALYAICLVFILVQKNEGEALAKLRLVDPTLGKPIRFPDLGSECGVNNIKHVLYDVHVFSHVLGWFLATVAFRDVALSWVSGFIWEIVEGSLEHSIPELRECWWDKLFVDLLGCNNLGIFLGWLTLKYLHLEEFNWAQICTPDGSKLHQTGLLYFIPGRDTLQQNYYGILKSAKALLSFVYPILILIQLQVNIFMIKTALWLPSSHWLVSFRCWIIPSLMILSGSSIYKRNDLTRFTLVLNMVLALEGLVGIRYGHSLLFAVNGDAFVVSMLVLFSTFAFVMLTLVGITRILSNGVRAICTPCNGEKIKCA